MKKWTFAVTQQNSATLTGGTQLEVKAETLAEAKKKYKELMDSEYPA